MGIARQPTSRVLVAVSMVAALSALLGLCGDIASAATKTRQFALHFDILGNANYVPMSLGACKGSGRYAGYEAGSPVTTRMGGKKVVATATLSIGTETAKRCEFFTAFRLPISSDRAEITICS